MNLNDLSKKTIDLLVKCSSDFQSKLIKVALTILHSSEEDRFEGLKKLANDYNAPIEVATELVSVYLTIIRFLIDSNEKDFASRLVEVGFPEDFHLLSQQKEILGRISIDNDRNLNRLASLRWRLDISLNNSLVKKIPVSVILCFQLKSGKKFVINVDIKTFHKLRFNIALILKELNIIKNNSSIFN